MEPRSQILRGEERDKSVNKKISVIRQVIEDQDGPHWSGQRG